MRKGTSGTKKALPWRETGTPPACLALPSLTLEAAQSIQPSAQGFTFMSTRPSTISGLLSCNQRHNVSYNQEKKTNNGGNLGQAWTAADSSLALSVRNGGSSSGKSGSGPHKSRRKKPERKEHTHTLGACQSCPFTSQSLGYLRCPVVQQPSHTRVRRAQ